MTVTATDGRPSFPIGRLLLAVALVALAITAIDIFLLVFLAVILAVYLDALAELLERRFGTPRALGLIIGVLLVRPSGLFGKVNVSRV